MVLVCIIGCHLCGYCMVSLFYDAEDLFLFGICDVQGYEGCGIRGPFGPFGRLWWQGKRIE